MFRIIYWICATLALLLLLFDGAVGQVLTTTPDRGKVTRDPAGPTLPVRMGQWRLPGRKMIMHQNVVQTVLAAANLDNFVEQLIPAAVFALLGMALFGVAWIIVVKVTPFSIRKEIEDDQNTALGIILGAMILGISIIIAAAVAG